MKTAIHLNEGLIGTDHRMITATLKTPNLEYKEASAVSLLLPASSAFSPATPICTLFSAFLPLLTTMMFFKVAFAFYLAAIAIAAPTPNPQGDLGNVINGARTFSLNLCLLCTSLSTVDMSVKDAGVLVGDLGGARGGNA